MTVGGLVRETILLQRAYVCAHEWQTLNPSEDQCRLCSVIATPAGKEHLKRLAERNRHGTR